tara:strand:+ start:2023 stop:2586 length:564 start_codon:yes stop_codon:yes gene_type:complete
MGTPALIDAQSAQIIDLLNNLRAWAYSHADGINIANNGSATSGSVPTLTVDNTSGFAVGGSQTGFFAAASSSALTAGTAFSATTGLSKIAVIVLDMSGTAALKNVYGTEAATGAQVSPTDAEITTSLGHPSWARLADVLVTIASATSGTYVVDHDVRNTTAGVTSADLAGTEAAFSVGGTSIPVNRS